MKNLHIIIGLGPTGFSCVRHLMQCNIPVGVIDTRQNPPCLAEFQKAYPNVPLSLGKWDEQLLANANKLVVSPGISLQEPAIVRQIARGIPAIGDIELFALAAQAPVAAITGTNAKSTVTTLVGEMAKVAGLNVQVGGNLGTPALDLLITPRPALFVLELSSFQLETTYSLAPQVATILNITSDHMDRYPNLQAYCQAKQRIYDHCQIAVCNRDDPLTDCAHHSKQQKIAFTLNQPDKGEFGILKNDNKLYLAYESQRFIMSVSDLPILGRHYQANALAALAVGYGLALPMKAMIKTLIEFKGLPHRCQLVREVKGVHWYNDSKGTNVGATLAAIEGLGPEIPGKLILIAGGVGKNADFSPLISSIEKYVKKVILIGEAASILESVIGDRTEMQFAKTLEEAVVLSQAAATAGDSVLLSPACASFDMFKNFEHRGNSFNEIVRSL